MSLKGKDLISFEVLMHHCACVTGRWRESTPIFFCIISLYQPWCPRLRVVNVLLKWNLAILGGYSLHFIRVCVCVCSHTYIYIYKYVFLPPYSSNLSHARFLFLKMYLFFASLALCCGQAFCSCDEWGLLFIAVRRLLTAVTSHVEHRL